MRLFVIEDEQSLREDITKKLQRSGYEVDACGDGETASEYLSVEYYDLILLDLNLPKMDGMTLLRNFRKENHPQPDTQAVHSAGCAPAMRTDRIRYQEPYRSSERRYDQSDTQRNWRTGISDAASGQTGQSGGTH